MSRPCCKPGQNKPCCLGKAEAYSEEVQSALIADAEEKDWRLLSLVRLGTSYIMTLTKNNRILDLRLTNTERGVDVVYSVLMSQQPRRK